MAYNDLHFIVYKLLTYLYQQLKEGGIVEEQKLTEEYYKIPRSYWHFILAELREAGYASGYTVTPINGGGRRIEHLERICITFKGIEYLTDDALMEKVRREEMG